MSCRLERAKWPDRAGPGRTGPDLPVSCPAPGIVEECSVEEARVLIDHEGYRPNVGIIICNQDRRLFWGRRVHQNAWQFPQGGIKPEESPEQAMYRELEEEVGL
jgi:hypothetical protein